MDKQQSCFVGQIYDCTLKKLLILIIFIGGALQVSISQNFNIGVGLSYGGPLPTQVKDSTSGKVLPGLTAGMSYSIALNERFSFYPSLYYSFHGIEYQQSYTTDTLITVVFDETTAEVPSFYTAYVDGAMRLHYLDINFLFLYRIRKFQLIFGPYFSVLFAGRDKGNVRVVIGHGGFFDDVYETFNNYKAIRKLEPGIMIGSRMPVYKKIHLETRLSRSFLTLYNPGKLPDRGQGSVKMFNTFLYIALVYKFKWDQKF